MSNLTNVQETALRNRLRLLAHDTLKPPPKMSLSRWAESYLYLPATAAVPGKFRFDRAAYQREAFDALADPNIKKVVIMAAAQTMKTQAILAFIGYVIHLDPGQILLVQPTGKMAASFSKDRIDPMLSDCPVLRKRIASKRVRDGGNTAMHKTFAGGALSIASAGAPSDLRSRPIRYLLCDEVDGYEPTSEGDPIALARARTTTFWNAKEVYVSTPGDEEISRISPEYETTDKRIWMTPCHECGHEQELMWHGVKWDKDADGKHDPLTVRYECSECNTHWSEPQKNINVSNGRWVKTNPKSPFAGFRLNAINSSFVSMHDLVIEHLAALNDVEQRKSFVNTRLAETWKSDATALNDVQFLSRLEPYNVNAVPNEVLIVTAGIDVQIDRLEMEVVGWGVGDESWSLQYITIQGDPTSPAPWLQLEQIIDRHYTRQDGIKLKINATCIDTGGTATQDVFNFTTKMSKRNVMAIKGQAGPGRAIFPKKFGRWRGKAKGRYYSVGVDTAKERIYQQLRLEKPGPGFCHFPEGYTETYFDGLTAEKYIVKYKRGHPYKVWFNKAGVRNEPLDCRVYSTAARMSINLDMMKRQEALLEKAKELEDNKLNIDASADEPEKEKPTRQMRRRPPRGSGYISGLS